MYVTRRLSQVLKSPEILTAQPSSHGPNSGFLVIQDDESEMYTCFGCCKRTALKNLPFPQNKELLIRYTSFVVDKVETSEDPVLFIPLLNQPLSSNQYYAIVPHGKHKGEKSKIEKKKMYVTRPLSQLRKSPEILTAPPSSDGPNSGYLVIQDEESETYSCFGCCKNRALKDLPFPQNKELVVRYTTSNGENNHVSMDAVFLIPLLNQPLSSNRYYAIAPHGKHKGEAYTCSREEDKTTCCFCRCVKDLKPRPLDPSNIYQQLEIAPCQGLCASGNTFFASSLASDGFPPYFLRREGWTIHTKTPKHFKLDTAQGLDSKLRARRLPEEFDFSLSRKSSEPVVVGKWYSPFMFVKEGTLGDQVESSMYYEVTLEQRWEQIFTCRNSGNDARVSVDVVLENEEVFVGGSKAEWNAVDGVVWFGSRGSGASVGLRVELVERMKWEQERGGWAGGDGKINKVVELEKSVGWSEFGCYVLVERFNFRRMDGSLVMSYDYKHFHHFRSKWE